MSPPDGPALAASLAGGFEDAAIVVDAGDRVLAWNDAAETGLALTPADAGRTLGEVGLADRPGAVRLPLVAAVSGDAAAIVVWRLDAAPSEDDIALQKIRAMARLSAGVNHQGRNHLAGFGSFFGMRRIDTAFMAGYGSALIGLLEDDARRAPELLGAFTELARDRPPAPAPQPPRAKLGHAMLLTEYAMDVRRTIDIPDALPEVLADRTQLHRALVAVLVNMLDALGGPRARGAITATATAMPGDPAVVELVLEDDAPPVPPADAAHLFDRYPPVGASPRAGLDLAAGRRLAEADGGSLRYEPGPAGGNRFVFTLATGSPPDSSARPVPAAAPKPASAQAPLTVLVCDDEEAIRTLMSRSLERSGIRTLTASTGLEALAVLDWERVDLVMSDHRMSEMSGTELHALVAQRHPHLRTRSILMSGDAGDPEIAAFQRATGVRVLAKPIEPLSRLASTVREAAGAPASPPGRRPAPGRGRQRG